MRDAFDALAHPARRKILSLLRTRPMTAGELAEAFDISKPTLSGHFNILKDAGLIIPERQGATITYHLNMTVVEEATEFLLKLAKAGEKRK